ncbi:MULTISPECIES: hypothetical protein [Nostocales]|nr:MULTISPECIES: hypothetical protein [Nostocales]
MGNGQWAMGNGQWAMGNGQWTSVIILFLVPMPHAHCPMPHSLFF